MLTPDYGNSPELKRQNMPGQEGNSERIEDIQIYQNSIASLRKQEQEIQTKIDHFIGTETMRLGFEDELEGVRKQIKETEEEISKLKN